MTSVYEPGTAWAEERSVKDPVTGCWLWRMYKNRDGYGMTRRDRRKERAHRMSWILANGPIPDGLHVLHRCDVRACVNPDHLFLGANSDNMADMIAKGRQVSREKRISVVPRGEQHPMAKLNEAQVCEIRAASGTCQSIATRFGVCHQLVSGIRAGRIWRHLLTPAPSGCQEDGK